MVEFPRGEWTCTGKFVLTAGASLFQQLRESGHVLIAVVIFPTFLRSWPMRLQSMRTKMQSSLGPAFS
jgi:hypothetical protein